MAGLVVLALGVGLALPARAGRAAVLELQAPGLLPGAQRDLDEAIRASVAELGYEVQPLEQTRAAIADAQRAGLECVFAKDDCALKVGLVADVQAVVTTTVEIVDDKMVMRGLYLVTEGARSERRRVAAIIVLPAADGGTSVKRFVARLVTERGAPTPLPVRVVVEPVDATITLDGKAALAGVQWLVPGEHKVAARAEGYVPGDMGFSVGGDLSGEPVTLRLEPERAKTMTWVGWTAAGVGTLLTVGGAAGAAITEGMLQGGVVAHTNRDSVAALGLVGLVTASVGVAVVGVGVAVALTDG